MTIPTDDEILAALADLDRVCADDLESERLDFKPWTGAKSSMKVAVEYAVCFANADGGAIVFGVADGVVGRASAIQGARGYDLDVWRRGIPLRPRWRRRTTSRDGLVPADSLRRSEEATGGATGEGLVT